MSRVITLVAERDESTGELGLMIEGYRGYAVNSATEGLLIAHDLIEHPTLAGLGRIDEELAALGAIWMCRGRHGDLRRDNVGSAHSIEANIASDVTRMGCDLLHGADTYTDPPRTRPHDHDETFLAIIDIARRDIPAEFGEPLTREQRETIERYLAGALGWMRRGARTLARRFPRSQFQANNLFWAIAEACDDAIHRNEYGELFEGMRFRLTYGDGEARCDMIEEEY